MKCHNCTDEETMANSYPCNKCVNSSEFRQKQKPTNDPVNPNHYKDHYTMETIDLIKSALTAEEFKGYLKGNMLKYRFRAGFKNDRDEDLKKSNWYQDKLKETE